MGSVETKGRIEEIAFEKLEERGWTIDGGERNGADLDLFVTFEGIRGTVSFRNPFSVRGVADSASNPCFVRVELGEPTDEPTRWAVWDQYEFPTSHDSPKVIATVVYEAIGDGWTRVAAADVTPDADPSWSSPHATLETLLFCAELLAPSREEPKRRRALLKTQRHNFGVHQRTLSRLQWVVATLFLFVAPVLFYGAAFGKSTNTLELVLGTIVVSIPVQIFFGLLLAAVIRYSRRPRTPVEGMDAVVKTLRSTGMFETFKLTPKKIRLGLLVVVRPSGHPQAGAASFSISRIAASSSKHRITLDADLCVLTFPDTTNPEARFMPERWFTVDLKGPPEELSKLPVHHRSDQMEHGLRWLFKGEELESELENLFRNAAASLGGGAAPYR